MNTSPKKIQIHYYAMLREERGLGQDTLETTASTPKELYEQLRAKHGFSLSFQNLRVAINNDFQPAEFALKHGDTVVFIPPVAGG